MSMNIFITGQRKITFKKKNGKRSGAIQTITFDAFQTPTQITKDILASRNMMEAYISWVLAECSHDEEFPVFAEDDIFGEGTPVRVETVNHGKEHVAKFREWIANAEEEGFTINFEMI